MVFVLRFAEDEAVAYGDGIGGEDQGRFRISDFGLQTGVQLIADRCCLTVGKVGNEASGAEIATDAAFHIFGRRNYGEVVTGIAQQLAASR
jgi:hypothetical protein